MKAVIALVVLCFASVAYGQGVEIISSDLAKQRRDYETIRRYERERQINGPDIWERWCMAQVEKGGVLVKVIDKPAAKAEILVSEKFTELHSMQRGQLGSWLGSETFAAQTAKNRSVPVYIAKPDGTKGKKIGMLYKSDFKLTVKVKPDEDGDLKTLHTRLFTLPPAK